ncbi:MAG: TolC family protein [Candidatus Saganbacteria bacterium]|nr:TolC family protein [Candidatus Saganbacteria bacterium]
MRWFIISITTLILINPVLGLSLRQAVDQAVQQNPEIAAAKYKWEAAQDKLSSISTWPNPQFELMYEQVPQSGALTDATMRMYGLSQGIPFPGKLVLKRQRGEIMAEVARQNYRAKSSEIISAVKKAYYALFLADRLIQVKQENRQLLTSLARVVEAKYVVEKAAQYDVIKAKIELSLLTNELITLEQKRQTAQIRLNTLLYRDPTTPISIPESIDVSVPDLSKFELEEMALAYQPQLKAAEYDVLQSQKSLTLAKMQYLPDFKIKILQREMRTTGLDGWDASFMVDLPLWFWAKNSAISAAGDQSNVSKAAYENTASWLRFEVQDAYVEVDSANRLVHLLKNKIIPQAEQALRSATIAYQANTVDFQTLINSQKVLEDSELKYFQVLAELGQRIADLERIVGVELTGGNNNE